MKDKKNEFVTNSKDALSSNFKEVKNAASKAKDFVMGLPTKLKGGNSYD